MSTPPSTPDEDAHATPGSAGLRAPVDEVAADRWAGIAPAASPWLHEEVGRRMQERLEWIRLQPTRWASWEPVRGGLQAHAMVARRYPDARCDLVIQRPDHAQAALARLRPPWWNPMRYVADQRIRVCHPAISSVQMVWANMLLHQTARPGDLLRQWYQALAPGGFVMFSALGPDTLGELRRVYAAMGQPAPAQAFTDMHDWGDMLVEQGFAEPVMDMEHITLTFDGPARLFAELRELGRNLHPRRHPGLRPRGWLQHVGRQLQASSAAGPLSLSFEIIYGHALRPETRAQARASTAIGLDDMRQMLRQGKAGGRKS